ncbi:hypothetical protein yc1106_05166 [Curvularia clavata]|uniref:Nephrocystin 3-like N-terminal domain-containing protein n=1 Tax=Curvularia clavata TaxID=95742 RepID=A0A9Q8Z7L8_CURCL|nr:hypothetical protein yc1106_05166 [Curvularia clavata]
MDSNGNDSNNNTRLLWISGGPGKGKTILSVFLTEVLEMHTARVVDGELVFFFCAEDEKRNTAIAVLRGLVHQIITKRPHLVKHMLPYFETSDMTQQILSSLESLWLIFVKLVTDAELGTMFCMIDGLDEGVEGRTPRVLFLIRLDHDNNEKVDRDIKPFESARVEELSMIHSLNDNSQAFIQKYLLAHAEDTFLWVGYVVQELLQKRTNKEIQEALTGLPSGLSAIYQRMLQQIPATPRELSRAILEKERTSQSQRSGKEIIRFLFDQQGANIPITKEVVAAAWNREVMTLLFDRKGADIPITKEAVVAAVGNEGRGNEVIFHLDNEPDFHNTKQQAQSTGSSWKDSRYLDESASTVFSSEEEKLTEGTSACDSHTFPVFQPPGGDFEGDDNASVASYDTFEMTPDEDLEVIACFTDALCERACNPGFLLNIWSMLFDILQVKIKKFSQTVQKDNPRDVIELNPKRKIAKAIYRFRRPILNGFVRRLLVGDQRSTSTEPESIQQKPLLGYDIPLEPIEQKIQRMESIVVGSQAPLFDLNHEHEADSESSDSSDCHSFVLQTRLDFVALHGYFKNHPAFGALNSDIQRLMKHFQYDALEHIRQSLSRITRNTSKPTALTAETFKVQFHADWDLVGFLEEPRSHGLNDDLSSVFTITGHTQAAQLETVANFVLHTWNIQLNSFRGWEEPRTYAYLEWKICSDPSRSASFRKSLMGLITTHEPNDVEKDSFNRSGKLQHVMAELLDTDPSSIKWSDNNTISYFDDLKNKFEDWTKDWGWWPLKRPQRAFDSGEARLHWSCCEKYKAHRYEPRREEFLNGSNLYDYQFEPSPMDFIPPIGQHQFYDRFHACYNLRPIFHFYHKRTSFNESTRDFLKLFPKS